MDLVWAVFEEDFPGAVEHDPSAIQVVLQPFTPGVDLLARCATDHRRAGSHDPPGMQLQSLGRIGLRFVLVRLALCGFGHVLAGPGEIDRQPLAVELIAGTFRMHLQHVHVVFEGGYLLGEVETERAAASDFDRQVRLQIRLQIRLGRGRSTAGLGLDARHEPLLAKIKAEPLQLADLEQLDAGHVRTAPLCALVVIAGQELDPHLAAAAVVRTQAEIDGVRGRDLLFAQLHVAGDHQEVIFGAG